MKKKKGFVPFIMVVVVLVIGGVGVFFINNNKSGKILPELKIPGTAGVGLNSNCELNDPELCRYIDKSMKMVDSYETGFTGSSVTTDKDGKKSENIWEMVGEKTHFTTFENGKEISNMIHIGDTTYMKDMIDEKWTKFTFKTTGESSSNGLFNADEMKKQFTDVATDMKDKTTYKAMGKEACGRLQCFKYEISNPLTSDMKEFIYFDDQEYIMRKMRIESKGSFVTETMFDFKPVNIKEPSPIKEGPGSGGFIPDTESSQIDEEDSAVSFNAEDLKQAQELIEQMQSSQ